MDEMVITKIVHQSDRVLLYGKNADYCLIANLNDDIKVGDMVEYEPDGVNFGWFSRVISRRQAVRQ